MIKRKWLIEKELRSMGKKIEALRRSFPYLPKISIAKMPEISMPRVSASGQLLIIAMMLLIGGIIGSIVTIAMFKSLLPFSIMPFTVIYFCSFWAFFFSFWFMRASRKLHGDIELW